MQSRLNTMQKSMVQWNEMHPYSAVHVVKLRSILDQSRLRTCINTTIERRGLSSLTLDPNLSSFEYAGGPADCDLLILAGSDEPLPLLVSEMERQLNLPFPSIRAFCPFRFLVAPAGDCFFLGLVYFHAAADAESVVRLLQDIVAAYTENSLSGFDRSLEFYSQR